MARKATKQALNVTQRELSPQDPPPAKQNQLHQDRNQSQDQTSPLQDWDLIKKDYENGALTLRALAAKHGLKSHAPIMRRVKREGWLQDSTRTVRSRQRALSLQQSAAEALAKKLIAKAPETQDEAIDASAAVQVELVRQHRAILGDLHSEAQAVLAVVKGEKKTLDNAKALLDHLNKLSMISLRLIPLEREAHGMDQADEKDALDTIPLKDRLKAYRKAGEWDGKPVTSPVVGESCEPGEVVSFPRSQTREPDSQFNAFGEGKNKLSD